MERGLLIFDIETIPDVTAAKGLTGCDSDSVELQRDALTNYHLEITEGRNAFLRQPFHQIVAISCALVKIEYGSSGQEEYVFKRLGSLGEMANYSERELVARFFKYLSDKYLRLVSFNGRTFDLPVIKYRAMKYGLACPKLVSKEYSYRYSHEWNHDLLETLSDYGASARIKMNEVCAILGLPGKFGVDGSQVTDLYDAGNLKSIRDYCETDVLNTFLVYLREALFAGRTNLNAYNNAIEGVLDYIDQHSEEVHLQEFKQAWTEACGGNFLLPV